MTGLTLLARELADKQLQLLKETVPRLERVAILASTANLPGEEDRARYEAAGRSLGLQASVAEVGSPPELDTALEGLRRSGIGAIVVLSDSYLLEPNRDRIIAQALRHRLPAIYWLRSYVDAGGPRPHDPAVAPAASGSGDRVAQPLASRARRGV